MTQEEKRKIADFEKDLKQMKKDNKKTFAEFKNKKTLPQKLLDSVKSIFRKN